VSSEAEARHYKLDAVAHATEFDAESITSCIAHLSDDGYERIDPSGDAQVTEVEFVNQIADFTCAPAVTRDISASTFQARPTSTRATSIFPVCGEARRGHPTRP
jgi:hypothetical protein